MEDFGIEIGQVAHDEDENGFDDEDVIGEPRNEARQKAPDDTDQGTAHGRNQKWADSGQNVRVLHVLRAQSDVNVKHLVQHLLIPIPFSHSLLVNHQHHLLFTRNIHDSIPGSHRLNQIDCYNKLGSYIKQILQIELEYLYHFVGLKK